MNELERRKVDFRKKYISIRNKIENKQYKSIEIFNKVIENEIYKQAKIIALYKSLASEVSTDDLIEYSMNIGKVVVLPRVVRDELKFYKIDSIEENFIKSKFGIEEPKVNENNLIEKSKIELIIVPGVCFDREKNRMGFGKGYYDRYLLNTNLKTIGLCFSEQLVEILPVDKYDVKMQQIITEKEVY